MAQALSSNVSLLLPISYRTSFDLKASSRRFLASGSDAPQFFKPLVKAMNGETHKYTQFRRKAARLRPIFKRRIERFTITEDSDTCKCAGMWSPSKVQEIMKRVDEFLERIETEKPNPIARDRVIKEGEGEYKMRFEMPGMSKEDVKVSVKNKILVIEASKDKEWKQNWDEVLEAELFKKEEKEEQGWSAESYGLYSRLMILPDNVQFDKITADMKDGILYVTVPKAATPPEILDIPVQ